MSENKKKAAAVAFSKYYILIFLGFVLVLNGILFLLISSRVLAFSIRQLWPVSVMLFGVSLFASSLVYFRRVKSVYLFPSALLVVLGVCFLFFSLHIIKDSLVIAFLKWWPIILIAIGLVLIILFYVQKAHKKDFPYMKDDSLVEDDE